MTAVVERRALLARACAADRRVRALDQAVTAMCVAAIEGDGPACSACVWEQILKPLARPLIGWERGFPPDEAKDPGSSWQQIDLSSLLTRGDLRQEDREARRTPATTDTERWLRSAEAWDAVTGEWLARLHDADPGAGHGIGYLAGVSA